MRAVEVGFTKIDQRLAGIPRLLELSPGGVMCVCRCRLSAYRVPTPFVQEIHGKELGLSPPF